METSNKTIDMRYDSGVDLLAISGLSPRMSVTVIILVVSAVILPMAFMGVPDGFDLMQHMRFAAAYKDAILSGELIPRWPAKDNFGFGDIGIRYYPPLAYYVLGAVRIISGS
ncbi:MAG TPA: hypothetical protein VHQ01_05895, partial [Pyrinomonadaceae bacterium]|nr:hypothetical protein [Pyrinomonadaceae bacterium]